MPEDLILYIVLAIIIIFVISTIVSCFFTIEQQSVGIVQRFGKFLRIASAGINYKVPFIDEVVKRVSLKVEQLDVKVETKTKDNVFVHVNVSVQYNVVEEKAKDAYYKLKDPKAQITAYVFDVVRAEVPAALLDAVFEKKDDIAKAIKQELTDTMNTYGYNIVKALVTNIDPDQKVKDSMNEINAAQRLREAAKEKGEGEKVLTVKRAEADSESKELEGIGIAKQRAAIIDGLEKSVKSFQNTVGGGVDAKEVMDLLMMTQYFDTLKDIGASSKTNVIFIDNSPAAVKNIANQITQGLLAAEGVKHKSEEKSNESK